MEKIKRKTSLIGAALTFVAVLFASTPVRAQYMSFFGDNTWEYHVTYLTNTPEDYLNYPPESQSPTPLNVYCRTVTFKYNKSSFDDSTHHYLPLGLASVAPMNQSRVYEDTVYGRLYVDSPEWAYETNSNLVGKMVCDMSLSEGDTFLLKDPGWYIDPNVGGIPASWLYDTVGDRNMIVDSVRYVAGRKVLYLSLLDHQDDYFFGTDYIGQLSDFQFSIRFIEGIGPSYGLLPGYRVPALEADLYPSLGLLLCMYKDDSLVYMADETLGCTQTCVGVEDHPQAVMNLYPNPATQYVVLDMSTGEEMDGSVVVTDMLGRQCLQQKATGTNVRIPVTDLPTGMYFLTYTDGERTVTRKFMKE